jgi:hypothetical protein
MKRAIIFLNLLTPFLPCFGQSTLCDCCTYESLQWTENFEKWFPPAGIIKDKIKSVTIYTTSRQSGLSNDTTLKIVDPEYREMILNFNEKGYVIERIYFNRLGKFHSINEFQRDSYNRIITKTFFYLDESTGVKDETFLPKKWIYSYNDSLLIKKKQLGNKFIELPDKKSEYFTYDYDPKARLVSTTHFTYYDDHSPYIFKSKTTYDDAENTKITITRHKGKVLTKEKTTYYSDKNSDFTVLFNGKGKKIGDRFYDYNNMGMLTGLETINLGMFTECLDGGNLIEFYSYSDSNLLTRIEHIYKNTFCTLRFEFQ